MSTVQSCVACMVFLNQASLPTNFSENVSSNMDTTNATHTWSMETYIATNIIYIGGGRFWNQIHQGRTCKTSHWCTKKNYIVDVTWTGSLYYGINLEWNYKEGYIDVSMPSVSRRNSSKMTILNQRNPSTAHTHPIQSNMARQSKIYSQKIPAIYVTRMERNVFNKSSAASSLTHA